jgi:IgA-specific serine endopeptidase
MHKQKVLKTILLSTAVLTVASAAIMLQQNQNSVDRTVKTEEVSKQDLASNSSDVSNVKTKTESTTSTKAEEKPVANETATLAEKPVETEITVAQAEAKPVETKADAVAIKEVAPSERPVATKLVEKQVTKVAEKPKVEKQTNPTVAEQPKVASKPVEQPKVDKPTETKPVEQPKTEVPKAEQPNVEAPKVKKVEQPKTEKPVVAEKPATPAPAVEKPAPAPKAEVPKSEVPAPKVETPAPKVETPKTEAPEPKLEAPVVSEKGIPEVQPELPEYHEAKGEPEVQPALPEFTTPAEIPSKPAEQPKVEQPVAPETPVVSEKGEPLVQPELPEFQAENGEVLVQPELPEFHAETGDALVQPELPEGTVPAEEPEAPSIAQPAVPEAPIVTEKGEPLVQPELPEFHAENGTPEVQLELPEFHFETGDALVQPELPEYHESKGEPEVQPTLPEFKLKTVSQEETIKIPAVTMNVTNSELNEGETKIVTQPKDGSITREYEVVLDEHDNILSKKLVNETRVEAINGITSIGTKPVKKVFGETGMYRFSEHLSDENILEFREDVKLTADEIHALGQDEINKRVEQNLENTITVQDKQRQNLSHMDSAPLSDETINNLNGDTYINHKNIGLKVLELVNAERKRLGIHELTWSDPLYTLTKIRANEVRENGSIRFYTEEGKTLKHVRDDKGTPWYTVRDNTEFEDSALGENLAGYSIRPNIYKAFSEKYIADQLYNQWKNSPHHYANMIKEKYNRFAFDVAYSKFWRDGHTDVTYKKQGVLGVQLFAD